MSGSSPARTTSADAAVAAATAADASAVIALTRDADAGLRLAAAQVLPLLSHGDSPTVDMVRAAVVLTSDPDARVRDWACFARGQQWRDVGTDEVRHALAARLDDSDPDARCEALLGLAVRRDPRAVPHVGVALTRADGDIRRLELIAAGALSDPSLHEFVLLHQSGWDDDDDAAPTSDLVRRLTDAAGVGEDVITGVCELHRRAAQGQPYDDTLQAWHVMSALLDIAPWRPPEMLELVAQKAVGDDATLDEVHYNSALAQLAAR